jgi:IclR family KDG regulon transcriptional repressor
MQHISHPHLSVKTSLCHVFVKTHLEVLLILSLNSAKLWTNMKVQSAERMFDILEVLSGEKEGLRLTEIGRRVGLHKSTVYRFLATMEKRGYVEKIHEKGLYTLGLKFIELSAIHLNNLELATEAQPYLQRLAHLTNLAVYLAVRDKEDIVYIEKVETVQSIRKYSIIGRRAPSHCTALGKALLTGLCGYHFEGLFQDKKLKPYTQNTITDIRHLMAEVRAAKERGWTEDNEEYEEGVRCIAAPICDYRNNVIAAVSTSGPTSAITKQDVERIAGHVMDAASEISKRMGYCSMCK